MALGLCILVYSYSECALILWFLEVISWACLSKPLNAVLQGFDLKVNKKNKNKWCLSVRFYQEHKNLFLFQETFGLKQPWMTLNAWHSVLNGNLYWLNSTATLILRSHPGLVSNSMTTARERSEVNSTTHFSRSVCWLNNKNLLFWKDLVMHSAKITFWKIIMRKEKFVDNTIVIHFQVLIKMWLNRNRTSLTKYHKRKKHTFDSALVLKMWKKKILE